MGGFEISNDSFGVFKGGFVAFKIWFSAME